VCVPLFLHAMCASVVVVVVNRTCGMNIDDERGGSCQASISSRRLYTIFYRRPRPLACSLARPSAYWHECNARSEPPSSPSVHCACPHLPNTVPRRPQQKKQEIIRRRTRRGYHSRQHTFAKYDNNVDDVRGGGASSPSVQPASQPAPWCLP
jgi:hypothetical protein